MPFTSAGRKWGQTTTDVQIRIANCQGIVSGDCPRHSRVCQTQMLALVLCALLWSLDSFHLENSHGEDQNQAHGNC